MICPIFVTVTDSVTIALKAELPATARTSPLIRHRRLVAASASPLAHGRARQRPRDQRRASRPPPSISSGSTVGQAAVVQLHDRARVELLQPARALLDRRRRSGRPRPTGAAPAGPVRPPAGLGDLGPVAQHPPPRLEHAARAPRRRPTRTTAAARSRWRSARAGAARPCSSTRAPRSSPTTTARASPASTGGTNASASTGGHAVPRLQRRLGHPYPQIPRADQQRLVGLQHVRVVGQVGQPGPTRRPAPRAPRCAAAPDPRPGAPPARRARIAASTPGSAVERTQRLVHPQVGREECRHGAIVARITRPLLELPLVGDPEAGPRTTSRDYLRRSRMTTRY